MENTHTADHLGAVHIDIEYLGDALDRAVLVEGFGVEDGDSELMSIMKIIKLCLLVGQLDHNGFVGDSLIALGDLEGSDTESEVVGAFILMHCRFYLIYFRNHQLIIIIYILLYPCNQPTN